MKKRNVPLDLLRVIAITSVILLHVLFIFRNKYFLVNNTYFMFYSFLDAFTRIGVPIFFMLTGILLLDRKDEHSSFIKKRIPKLLISYVVFSCIYILFDVVVGNNAISIKDAVQIILSKQAAYHLWFMPVIIMIYLLIPFLQKLIENLNRKELNRLIGTIFIFGNIALSVSVVTNRLGRPLLDNFYFPSLIIYINYLFIGYYIFKYKPRLDKKITILALISIIMIPLLTYYISNNEMIDFFLNATSPFVVLTSTYIVMKVLKMKHVSKKAEDFLESVSNSTLYMYLVHVLVLSIFTLIFQKTIAKANLIEELLLILGLFVIVWIVSYIASVIINKIIKIVKQNIDKIKENLIRIFVFVFCLMIIYFIVTLLLNSYHFTTYKYPLLFLSVLLLIGLFYIINKYQEFLFKNRIINIILLIVYFLFQLLVIYCYVVRPTWDFGTIYYLARDVAANSEKFTNIYYLYICDNNIPLAAFFSVLFKVLFLLKLEKFTGLVAIGINIIAIDITFYYLYKLLKNINNNLTKPFFIFCLLFSPLVMYLPIFYSDTLSLPFICIPLYFYYKFISGEQKNKYLVLIGLLMGIGVLIKATVGILMIAIVITAILLKNLNLKQASIIIVLLLVPICLNKVLVNITFSKEEMNKSKKPATHFIMMGLKNNGGFDEEDLEFTTKIQTYSEKKEKNIEIIKERLYNYYSDHKLISFYNKKANYTWADGTFFADKTLGLEYYHQEYQKYIQSYYKESWFYFNMANAEWLLVLLLMLMGMIFRKNLSDKEKPLQLTTSLSIFGLFLFLLIWETRSRYLVNFVPLFLINAYIGLYAFNNYLKTKKVGNKK